MDVTSANTAEKDAAHSADALDATGAAIFRSMGTIGVYARTRLYEEIVDRLSSYISRHREPDTEVLRFPPVMSRHQLETSGYLQAFPNLIGCVCALHGTEAEIRTAADSDWTASLSPADLVLSPAACYPVYPLAASRGPVPSSGLRFDVAGDCFRHEPSPHFDRLQSFRMREYVFMGAPDGVRAFRDQWMTRGRQMAEELGLRARLGPASDPFFGRTGQVMAISQLQQALKFELLVSLRSDERPTACMSFNHHRDHFGTTWNIRDAAGATVHTSCVAFGMDRLAVAMFHTHGLDPEKWPVAVRAALAF